MIRGSRGLVGRTVAQVTYLIKVSGLEIFGTFKYAPTVANRNRRQIMAEEAQPAGSVATPVRVALWYDYI